MNSFPEENPTKNKFLELGNQTISDTLPLEIQFCNLKKY